MSNYTLRAGDVLWNSTGTGTIGRACAVKASDLDEVSVVDSHITILRPSDVDASWLRFWIELPFVQSRVAGTGSTNQVELSRDMVVSMPIPVPKIEEQRRLLGMMDDLFADLGDGEALLARARDDLGIWRKALIEAAVTGELTAEWRAANPLAETGADLLARILDERRARWLAEPRNKGKPYVEPRGPNHISSITLPENWTWASLAQIATEGPTNGYSPAKSKDGTGTLALKLTATTSGSLRLDSASLKRIGEVIPAESSLYLREGDLLFQRGNTREYVGMAAIYDGPVKTFIYPDLMIRIRTGSRTLTDWVWRWSNSPHGRTYLMNAAQGGAGTMPKISGETLRSMPIPLPPISEQKRALSLIETAMSDQETLSVSEKEASSSATDLRRSILIAAFRGELFK